MPGWLERIAAAPDPVKRLVIKVSVAVLTLCIAVIWLASQPWQSTGSSAQTADPQAEALRKQTGQTLEEATNQFSQLGEQIKNVLGHVFNQSSQPPQPENERLPSTTDSPTTTPAFGQTQLESLAQKIEAQTGSTTVSGQNNNVTK